MKQKRKICIVTGTRAEYGLLFWLMKEIKSDHELQLQIIVTGMHLSHEFGKTYQQIEDDGFTIDAKVEMLLSSDTSVGITKSIGLGTIGFADAFYNLKPDIIVLLGDRFEIIAAAQAAMILKILIAHIHGGETTEGAYDENIRHAITKMAHCHFVAAETYRKRVVQLGENPNRVFNFGAPGLDHIPYLDWLSRDLLEDLLAIRLKSPLFLITYHPATLGREAPKNALNELLEALENFSDATVIFTYPNADTNARPLIESIKTWVKANEKRAYVFNSLGQQRYLSLMRVADVVIGNSSSGIIEAPVLKTATVNIGDRQKGRLKASSIVDSIEKKSEIVDAIQKAMSNQFRSNLKDVQSFYGSGHVSRKIKDTLRSVILDVRKPFFDLEHSF